MFSWVDNMTWCCGTDGWFLKDIYFLRMGRPLLSLVRDEMKRFKVKAEKQSIHCSIQLWFGILFTVESTLHLCLDLSTLIHYKDIKDRFNIARKPKMNPTSALVMSTIASRIGIRVLTVVLGYVCLIDTRRISWSKYWHVQSGVLVFKSAVLTKTLLYPVALPRDPL